MLLKAQMVCSDCFPCSDGKAGLGNHQKRRVIEAASRMLPLKRFFSAFRMSIPGVKTCHSMPVCHQVQFRTVVTESLPIQPCQWRVGPTRAQRVCLAPAPGTAMPPLQFFPVEASRLLLVYPDAQHVQHDTSFAGASSVSMSEGLTPSGGRAGSRAAILPLCSRPPLHSRA